MMDSNNRKVLRAMATYPIHKQGWGKEVIDLHFVSEVSGDDLVIRRQIFNGETWEDIPTGAWCAPCLEIPKEVAQMIVDNLWTIGIRPSEAKGSSGQLEAVQKHLTDMRTIAFDKLGIKE